MIEQLSPEELTELKARLTLSSQSMRELVAQLRKDQDQLRHALSFIEEYKQEAERLKQVASSPWQVLKAQTRKGYDLIRETDLSGQMKKVLQRIQGNQGQKAPQEKRVSEKQAVQAGQPSKGQKESVWQQMKRSMQVGWVKAVQKSKEVLARVQSSISEQKKTESHPSSQ